MTIDRFTHTIKSKGYQLWDTAKKVPHHVDKKVTKLAKELLEKKGFEINSTKYSILNEKENKA